MSKLERIVIKGFKSIKEVDLKLSNINILIGSNGAGKSNFISFFRLLNNMIENNLETYVTKSGGANTLFHYGVKNTPEIFADLYFGQNRYKVIFESTDNDQLFFAEEHAMFLTSIDTWYSSFDRYGKQETGLLTKSSQKVTKYVRESLKNWVVYHFHDTSSTADVKKTCNIDDNFELRHNASNLAAYLYYLKQKHNENYMNIVKTIQIVAPYFEDFILRPSLLNEGKIKIEWKEVGSDQYLDANSFSDGTLRFICLATVLMQPSLPETIIIDEPELGLHPYALNILASLIKQASVDSQIIISTQSVPLINHFTVNDIITVDRDESSSIFNRCDDFELKSWLEDYTLGELWEKNLLGGRP